MRLRAALLASTALIAMPAAAAPLQPASITVTPTTMPEVVQVLDNTGTWVPMGNLNPLTHTFTPVNAIGVVTPDGYVSADASMSAGSAILSSPSRPCTNADIGKIALVAAVGASQAPLHSSVASCGGSQFNLNNQAGVSGTNVQWAIGTDNSAVINAFIAAHPGANFILPSGIILVDANSIFLKNIALTGAGILANRTAAFGQSANYGTTIVLTNQATNPFIGQQSVMVSGVNFFYPGIEGTTPIPPIYQALFQDDGSTSLSDFTLENSSVINAYETFTQNPTAHLVLGRVAFNHDNIYSVHRDITMENTGEVVSINNSLFNASVYNAGVNRPGNNLPIWSMNNGAFIYVPGNGSPTTCSTYSFGGLSISNSTFYVKRNFMSVVGGKLTEVQIDASVDIGAVAQVLSVDSASYVGRFKSLARMFVNGAYGVKPTIAGFDFEGTCGTPSTDLGDFQIAATQAWGGDGDFMDINGTNLTSVNISGTKVDQNFPTTVGGPFYLAKINNPNVRFSMNGGGFFPYAPSVGANARGVLVQQAAAVSVTGYQFKNVYNAVDWSSMTGSPPIVVTGSSATGTSSPTTLAGAAAANVTVAGNNFDLPGVFPNSGFTGTKTAGGCTFVIGQGLITSVTGC